MDANSISVNCLLENYKAIYGEIVFPDKPGEGQAKKRRDIYANPAGWMYSFDGLRWQTAPMDIGKIDYPRAMFRKIPAGIIVGVNDTVKKAPENYYFSTDNGYSWSRVYNPKKPTSHNWIYHGRHEWIWFKC